MSQLVEAHINRLRAKEMVAVYIEDQPIFVLEQEDINKLSPRSQAEVYDILIAKLQDTGPQRPRYHLTVRGPKGKFQSL